MIKNSLFYSDKYKLAEQKIKDFLNKEKDFLSERTASSPRAVGDAIQSLLADNLDTILIGAIGVKDYSKTFERRAMADVAFYDDDQFYYCVDVKTHRLETKFNMPNLTSVGRLAKFYSDDKNCFVILEVAYSIKGIRLTVEHVNFVPIEFLSWSCLTIGALGLGQIQIRNSNVITIDAGKTRKEWMLELCEKLAVFYPKEVTKIGKRITYFQGIKKYWEDKI